ncbi:MAG TPA: substrate-binding domain-containing protein [Acidimicrobiales bacterium]|nr:substrate-binding domain-containing protein [Acidimicrobiales bacterium]
MQRTLKRTTVVGTTVLLMLGLVACGDDDSTSSSQASGSAGAASISTTDLTSDFSAMAKLKDLASQGKGKIAVLLPDTQSSARYVSFDAPYLTKAFEAAGLSSDDFSVQNAQGSASTMQTQADAAITNGASVLVVDALDSGSGAAIEQDAKSKGVATIDYDRLTLNGSSSYYVSFDNVVVGKSMGQGLVDCVNQWNVQKPQVLEMDGDPTDNNATLFAQGYNSVLKPKFDSGDYVKVGEPAGTWDSQTALTNFEQQFTAHTNINAVVTANDTLANSAISVLKTNQIPAKTIPTTGQDATLIGLQNILAGYQCMSVYKPIYTEAQAAVAVALYVRAGETPPSSLVNGTTNNEQTDVPSVLLKPVSVNADNMNVTVVKDKFVDPAELCAGSLAAACRSAGIGS